MSDKLDLKDSVMTIGDVTVSNTYVPTPNYTTIVVKRQRPWVTIFTNISMVTWPIIAISFQASLGACLIGWICIIGFRALLALFEG